MRKTILALFLALAACLASAVQATAMEGFDLGDMPPLPPPLLDDSGSSPPPLSPPGSGLQSPLVQSGAGEGGFPPPSLPTGGSSPLSPPPAAVSAADAYNPPSAVFGDTPLPPPPPLAPPPIDSDLLPAPTQAGASTTPGFTAGGELAPPPIPAQPTGDAAAVGLGENEIPRPGQITGGRVNVRAGPNTQYESIAVLTTGTPLTVLAKNGEWLKIIYPSDHLASIHKRFVDAEVPAEIPEAGVPGIVNADDADVHAFYWDKSTVVGKLKKGDPVVIKQERGQWYRILAPANARAFVFAKYVKLDSDGPVVADRAPLPVNDSVDMSAVGPDGSPAPRPKVTPEEEKVRELKEARAKELAVQLDKIAEREEELRKIEEERLRRFEEQQKQAEELVKARAKADLDARMLQANQLEAALQSLDSRLIAIDGEKARQADAMGRRIGRMVNPPTIVGSAMSWVPPDPPTGGYAGWVENIGRVGGAPSPFRLTRDGEIRFWLISDKHDLNQFANLRVLLDGQVQHAGGTTASILRVDRIRLLTEWEVAGGMPPAFNQPPRQPADGAAAGQMGQGGQLPQRQQPPQQQQPYVDPYANAADVTDYDMPGFEGYRAQQMQQQQLQQPPQQQGGPGMVGRYGPPEAYNQPYAPQPQQPSTDPFASYGSTYGGGYATGAPNQYGSQYGGFQPYNPQAYRPPDDDNIGTADLVTSVEAVFGPGYVPPTSDPYGVISGMGTTATYDSGVYTSGSYGAAPQTYVAPTTGVTGSSGGYDFPNAQPASGPIRPSDSSQLPDVVGGVGSYSTGAALVSGQGVGMGLGEVETDVYERPIINEIAP